MSTTAQEAVASYVTDMIALEHHLVKAIGGQISDLQDEPHFADALRKIHTTSERHIGLLEELATRRAMGAQGVAETVKKAASVVLGMGAAAVDFVRSEKLPKNVRDDYAAVSLACMGYVMLQTTAMALGDDEVAKLAQECLTRHAECVMTLNRLAPEAVIEFLQSEGLPARANVLPQILENIQSAWASDARAEPVHH